MDGSTQQVAILVLLLVFLYQLLLPLVFFLSLLLLLLPFLLLLLSSPYTTQKTRKRDKWRQGQYRGQHARRVERGGWLVWAPGTRTETSVGTSRTLRARTFLGSSRKKPQNDVARILWTMMATVPCIVVCKQCGGQPGHIACDHTQNTLVPLHDAPGTKQNVAWILCPQSRNLCPWSTGPCRCGPV